MGQKSAIPPLVFVVIAGVGMFLAYALLGATNLSVSLATAIISLFLAVIASSATKIANQWERTIVLRLGRFRSMKGPGLFFIIPIIDTVPYWIDVRVITSTFKAEKTLTKDTVPVDVDAVLFWKVLDPQKAALDVADYQSAISWAA
jgi:regulator of protease activity HflC (stomatin/prohibitin superfamily)